MALKKGDYVEAWHLVHVQLMGRRWPVKSTVKAEINDVLPQGILIGELLFPASQVKLIQP